MAKRQGAEVMDFNEEDPGAVITSLAGGVFDPQSVITNIEPLSDVPGAYEAFDRRDCGRVKAALVPGV